MRIYRLLPSPPRSPRGWAAYQDDRHGSVYEGVHPGDSIVPIETRPSGREFWFYTGAHRGWYLHLKSGAIVDARNDRVEEV